MKILSKYDKEKFKKRYFRYKILFFISFFITSLAFFLRLFIDFDSFYDTIIKSSFSGTFFRIITFESIFLLLIFIFGITVYSPAIQFILSFFKGIFYGFSFFGVVGLPVPELKDKIFMVLYSVFSSCLFSAYSSFCTSVSLRLFSDGITFSLKKEENRVFGGTMFNSMLFCNTVNLRFMFSYFLVFAISVILQSGITALYSFLTTL